MFRSKRIVFCIFDNDLYSIILYISLIHNKNIIFFINNNIDEKALNDLVGIYSPSYIVIKDNEFSLSCKYSKENNLGTYLIYKLGNEFEESFVANDELAILISTSGSTGSPKFVRISMENLQSNTFSIIDSLKIDCNSKTLTNLPLNYSYGLSVINTFLTAGGTLIINSHSITSKDFWGIVNHYKPNVFNGVPYHYEVISKFDDTDFSNLPFNTFTQAGGKIKEKTLERITSLCQKYSKKLFVMYGQTEATARISILPSEYIGIKNKSVGKSVPGGRIEIRSLNGDEIASPFTQGEIIYFGKNVSLGYCQNKNDLARGNDNNFELKTGDIGYLDSDNFLYIIGRNARFIKFMGNRVSLDDLENKLNGFYENVACVALDEKIYIFLEKYIDRKELSIFLFKQLNFKLDFETIVVINLPKTSNGKINYSLLQELCSKDSPG